MNVKKLQERLEANEILDRLEKTVQADDVSFDGVMDDKLFDLLNKAFLVEGSDNNSNIKKRQKAFIELRELITKNNDVKKTFRQLIGVN